MVAWYMAVWWSAAGATVCYSAIVKLLGYCNGVAVAGVVSGADPVIGAPRAPQSPADPRPASARVVELSIVVMLRQLIG